MERPSAIKWLWLALAVWGAIQPMFYFLRYMREHEGGLVALTQAWWVNDSVTGLTWDLTISALVLTFWVIIEAVQTRDWLRLLAVPATFCIGVSCGLPLYLYLRMRGV